MLRFTTSLYISLKNFSQHPNTLIEFSFKEWYVSSIILLTPMTLFGTILLLLSQNVSKLRGEANVIRLFTINAVYVSGWSFVLISRSYKHLFLSEESLGTTHRNNTAKVESLIERMLRLSSSLSLVQVGRIF